jgi:hypothetical protein
MSYLLGGHRPSMRAKERHFTICPSTYKVRVVASSCLTLSESQIRPCGPGSWRVHTRALRLRICTQAIESLQIGTGDFVSTTRGALSEFH